MSLSYVNGTTDSTSSNTSVTASVPSGISDGDLLLAFLRTDAAGTITAPSGWTEEANRHSSGFYYTVAVYSKVASSESGSYTWSWLGNARARVQVCAWSGDVNDVSPISEVSDTPYTTSNTTIRAAAVTAVTTNQDIIFGGFVRDGSTVTFSPPTSPATFTEDVDAGDGGSDTWITVARLNWSSSGSTGNVDGTLSTSQGGNKHAFALLLTPPNVEDTPPSLQTNPAIQVVLEGLTFSEIPNAIQSTLVLQRPLGEVTPSTFTGRLRGFRLFQGRALSQRDHNNYES